MGSAQKRKRTAMHTKRRARKRAKPKKIKKSKNRARLGIRARKKERKLKHKAYVKLGGARITAGAILAVADLEKRLNKGKLDNWCI